MKFFFICFCSTIAFAQYVDVDKFTIQDHLVQKFQKPIVQTLDETLDLNLDKNTDVRTTLMRPCPNYDLDCIRNYFALHSQCRIRNGPVPDPVYLDQLTYYYPFLKMSVTSVHLAVGGLSTGTIEDFYVNTDTDLTVLAVSFRNLRLVDSGVFLRYHRRANESAITKSQSDAFVVSFTTTTVFKSVNNLQLARSETTQFSDALPVLVIGPEAGINEDPTVAGRFAEFLGSARVVLQEGTLTVPSFTAGTFIQSNICDFGQKIQP